MVHMQEGCIQSQGEVSRTGNTGCLSNNVQKREPVCQRSTGVPFVDHLVTRSRKQQATYRFHFITCATLALTQCLCVDP